MWFFFSSSSLDMVLCQVSKTAFLDKTIQMNINIYFCVNVFTFSVSRRGSCSIVIIFKSLFHFILFVLFFKKTNKNKKQRIVVSMAFYDVSVPFVNFAQAFPDFAHDATVVGSLLTVSSTQILCTTWKQ